MTKFQSWRFLPILLLCFSCGNSSTTEQKTISVPSVPTSYNEAAATIVKKEITDSIIHQPVKAVSYSFPYNFAKLSRKMMLDQSLMEISGLAFLASTQQFLAINDEIGKLYFLNETDGKIVKTQPFADDGDYEGIALVDEDVYVVKSNGTFYHFNVNSDKKAKKIKTALSKSNDVEGLCYDANNQRLLLACKGSPYLNKNSKQKTVKAVYAFDVSTKKLNKKPVLIISDIDIKSFVEKQLKSKKFSKKKEQKRLNRALKFSPSAIAIHPTSKQYYLLSTVGKILVVCNQKGRIQHIEFLNDKHHTQPEGLCFSADGTLYVSNEGKGLVGTIYKYKSKK